MSEGEAIEQGLADFLTSQDELLKRQNELLRELIETEETPETVYEVNLSEGSMADAVRLGAEKATMSVYTGEIIPFPSDGAIRAFPDTDMSTSIDIDLTTGSMEIPGVGSVTGSNFLSLEGVGRDNAVSASLYIDSPVTIQTLNADGRVTGEYRPGSGGYVNMGNVKMSRVKIDSTTPFVIGGVFSTSIDSPLDPSTLLSKVNKFGYVSETPDPGNPVSIPMVPDLGTTVSDFNVDTMEEAVSEFGDYPILTEGSTNTLYVVENTGSNDAQVQLQGIQSLDEAVVADTDVHSDTGLTNFVTVAAGDTSIFESSLQFRARNMMVQSSSLGSPTSIRVQYTGTVPGMRG